MNAAGLPGLGHRSAVGIEKSLEHTETNFGRVVHVDVRDELRVGAGAGETQLPQDARDGVRHDHASAVSRRMAEDVVDLTLASEFDPLERHLER